jgi:hypothetical protein
MSDPGLLLLDLDGVVVYEVSPPLSPAREVLRLHQDLPDRLDEFGVPVVVLTHRSRAEARRIVSAAGLDARRTTGLMAAEDLALAALAHGNLARLLTRGLRKSLILPRLEARFGVRRGAMALIDDRQDNLTDLLASGLGLALQAPSDWDGATLTTFDLREASASFSRWRSDPEGGRYETLTPVPSGVVPWRRTGLCTRRQGRHLFNALRTASRHVRVGLESLARGRRAGEPPPHVPGRPG